MFGQVALGALQNLRTFSVFCANRLVAAGTTISRISKTNLELRIASETRIHTQSFKVP